VSTVTPTTEPTPQDDATERRRRAVELGTARLQPAVELGAFWQELEHRDLVRRAAAEADADPAMVTTLLDLEAETEGLPRTRLAGPGPFRQSTLRDDDDPGDQHTLAVRAAEYVRALHERWQLPELVAAAYVGALDESGRVTDTSAGSLSGAEYVRRFREAYRRYRDSLGFLPSWLVSPFGELPLSPRMIKFGYLGDYGEELAFEIRGEAGVALYSTIHLGLDLQVPGRPDGGRGTPIVAPFDGRIIRTADPIGGPFGIWLENPKLDLRARLMHMDDLVVGIESGVWVKAGQQLGVLGAQGTEGFPHLHLAFERLSDGARINPALYYRIRDPSDPQTATDRLLPPQLASGSDSDRFWYASRLIPAEHALQRALRNWLLPLEVPSP
jgi:murein DD-endopeptidase MepM/ murein hydrolase activator NlpD